MLKNVGFTESFGEHGGWCEPSRKMNEYSPQTLYLIQGYSSQQIRIVPTIKPITSSSSTHYPFDLSQSACHPARCIQRC